MGEYATRKSDGAHIKIGTCEQMYYMRAEQVDEVQDYDFASCLYGIRFRFPFPDEDGRKVGEMDEPGHDFDRAFPVYGLAVPSDVEHHTVQFTARNGYMLNIPCPEKMPLDEFTLFIKNAENKAFEEADIKVHKNGYGGAVGIHSQKWVKADDEGPERLVTVCKCLGCGTMWRLHSWEAAAPVVLALREKGLSEMANRVEQGYKASAPSLRASWGVRV